MFCSEIWAQCKWSTSTKGKAAFATVMSMSFWNGMTTCLKVFAPLVKVLRLIDGDRKPAMGFVYEELLLAKEEIKVALNNFKRNYQPILDIIDARIKELRKMIWMSFLLRMSKPPMHKNGLLKVVVVVMMK
ncbi:hypothetical protein ACOSQ4_018784 [Xanthoceras sorbifolium]